MHYMHETGQSPLFAPIVGRFYLSATQPGLKFVRVVIEILGWSFCCNICRCLDETVARSRPQSWGLLRKDYRKLFLYHIWLLVLTAAQGIVAVFRLHCPHFCLLRQSLHFVVVLEELSSCLPRSELVLILEWVLQEKHKVISEKHGVNFSD